MIRDRVGTLSVRRGSLTARLRPVVVAGHPYNHKGEAMQVDTSAMPEAPVSEAPVAILLAGGRGSRLHELTGDRAKPAVAFGPRHRIVDFTLENLRRSGLGQVLAAGLRHRAAPAPGGGDKHGRAQV